LRKGLDELQLVMEGLYRKFDEAVNTGDYEHYPELEI
jgi:hypothetical protein